MIEDDREILPFDEIFDNDKKTLTRVGADGSFEVSSLGAEDTGSGDLIPENTVSGDLIPENTVSGDLIPENTVSGDQLPPDDWVSGDSLPEDLPEDSGSDGQAFSSEV